MRFAASAPITSFLNSKLDLGAIQGTGQKTRANERITQTQGDALIDIADTRAEAMIEAAKEGASATRAQGDAAGQSAMWGGISSGIGSLAGGFAGMNSNGATGIDANFSGITSGGYGSQFSPDAFNPSTNYWQSGAGFSWR